LLLTDNIKSLENNEKFLKIYNVIRSLIAFICMSVVFYQSINYVNAACYYDQQVSFRPICIAFGIFLLTMLDIKTWINIFVIPYIPVCYFFMHYAYKYQWIPDVCDYQYANIIRMGKIVALVWGVVLIAILIDIISNKGYRRLAGYSKLLLCFWICLNVLMLVFMRDYQYVPYMVIAFNAFAYAYSDKKNQRWFVDVFEISGLASFAYVMYMSLVHRPFDKQRYMSYFTNENTAGFYFAVITVIIFMRLFKWWTKDITDKPEKKLKKRLMIFFYLILFGISFSMALLNYARTTLVGLFFSFFVLFVIHFITGSKKDVLKRTGLAVLFVVLLFYPTFLAIRYIPAYINKPVFLAYEYDPEERIVEGDPVDSDKYTSITRYLRIVFGKWGLMINFDDAIYAEGEEHSDSVVEIDEDRDITNGRVEIWTNYIKRLNLTGNCPGHIYLEDGSLIYHAHNTYLHMAYQYGVIAGVIFGLLNAAAYICGAWQLFRKKTNDRCMVFAVCMLGMGMMAQFTETMVHPAYIITFSIYISILMIMTMTGKVAKSDADKSKA